MDDATDRAFYRIEKKYGPAECDCEGTCELAFKDSRGEIHHYRDIWEKIEDNHYHLCPMAVGARAKRKSTLCYCAELKKADDDAKKDAEECLRCHNLADACKCGAKAQLI